MRRHVKNILRSSRLAVSLPLIMHNKSILATFTPDFAKSGGLLPVVTQCAESGRVLMLAYMNGEAWEKTLASGEAHYYSRSRKMLWHKGESSGNVQKIRAVRLDCDSDAILLLVEQIGGAACHEGYVSCFFRELSGPFPPGAVTRENIALCCEKKFDPQEVYK
jgi:phosphoribosyl-AMP cyclohydrolase